MICDIIIFEWEDDKYVLCKENKPSSQKKSNG